MANLSQKKREKMLSFLQSLKQTHSNDASIIAFNEIENALLNKKYGLVWEEHSEHVDEMLQEHIPVFIEDTTRKITTSHSQQDYKNFNFLIEGDNLHSLKLLEKTHRNKIDVIYIDPPYNTGNKDFLYDDSYIDKNDGYSHSKWLSFMSKRLEIARSLLKYSGFIFISIDDNEFSQLKLLCDEIFNESNYVNEIIWQKLTASKSQSVYLSKLHEKVLVYRKSENARLNKIYEDVLENDKSYKYIEENTGRKYGSFDFTQKGQGDGRYFGDTYLEPPKGKHWIWSQEKIDEGIKNGTIIFTKNGMPRVKRYLDNKKGNLIGDIWINNGVTPLSSNSNERVGFDTQKPLSLIKQILNTQDTDITILDFFAGSGTTGHAVTQLNKEDGGNRQYILCTNNENNICEDVTYQRLKNIQADLPHNLKYFKTDFIKKFDENDRTLKTQLMDYIKELIELEYMCEIDGVHNILVKNESELDVVLNDNLPIKARLFIAPYVLLSRAQNALVAKKQATLIEIPEYYFRHELIEAGEL